MLILWIQFNKNESRKKYKRSSFSLPAQFCQFRKFSSFLSTFILLSDVLNLSHLFVNFLCLFCLFLHNENFLFHLSLNFFPLHTLNDSPFLEPFSGGLFQLKLHLFLKFIFLLSQQLCLCGFFLVIKSWSQFSDLNWGLKINRLVFFQLVLLAFDMLVFLEFCRNF